MITCNFPSIYDASSSIEKTYPASNILTFFEVKSAVPPSNAKITR
jgi:hypothetical protein